jgi:hypothetical protein
MTDHGHGPAMPPGWRRGPDGQAYRRKKDGSWWWQASDGNWYPEEQHPSYRPAPPPPPPVRDGPRSPEVPAGPPTAIFSPSTATPLPRRAWTAFRRWPRAAQVGIAAAVVLVIAVAALNDDPPEEVVATAPSTSAAPTTTRELVLPRVSTTASPVTRATTTAVPRTTVPPVTEPPETETVTESDPAPAPETVAETVPDTVPEECSEYYPGVCIAPHPPDLDCGEIPHRRFEVLQPDPHGFDGNDNDGIGCESG